MNKRFGSMVFTADSGAGTGGAAGDAGAGGAGGETKPPVTYEAWLAGQPEDVKGLITSNEKGLKSALQSERDARQKLEGELRDAASKAAKGSEDQVRLTKLADDLSESTRKADFYEAGVTAGVNNLKLAWLAAKTDDLFDKKGQPDFAALQKSYPELFGSGTQSNGAGAGTNSQGANGSFSMDDFIRRKAGVQA